MALTERPHIISFSKNEIRYVFQLTDLDRPGLFLQVKLLYAAIGSTPSILLQTFDMKQDSNGYVYLYISNFLDCLLDYVVPDFSAKYTTANDQACNYFIHYREITDADQDPDWIETEATDINPRQVIKGGIEKHKNSRNNFFINYLPVQKPFLTWQPSDRFIFPDENIFLSFLNTTNSTASYKILVSAYNTDGATTAYTIAIPTLSAFIVHMKADPATLAIAAHLTGQLYYYEVSILNNSNERIVNPYRFYIEYRPSYYYYDLLYRNSLSGFDFARVRGDINETFQRESEEIDGGFNLNDWTDKTKMHESKHAGLTVRRSYKGDVGYQRSKKEQSALVELLVSTEIYHLINNRWVPVLTLNKDQDLGFFSDKKRSFPIEWCLSESNEVYTPIELGFGEGSLESETGTTGPPPPDCIPITFVGSPKFPNGVIGVPYSYSFNVNGTTAISRIVNDAPSWMTIGVTGNTVNATGTPDVVASNINISITLSNCGPSLTFSDTIDVTEPANGTHFGSTTFISSNSLEDHEVANIAGDPGITVTVKLTDLTNTNGGQVQVNHIQAFLNNTWNVTLNGSGLGSLTIAIIGVNNHPSIIIAKFTIISVSSGTIGTPDVFTISKSF
jgi:hypothetical protein